MTPLEINQKIAELKGWEVKHIGVILDGCGDCSEPDENSVQGYNTKGHDFRANWAESISDAWELFEDMPYRSKIDNLKERGYMVSVNDIFTFSPKATLAICASFIKWKESQNV